jgi:signal peptidase
LSQILKKDYVHTIILAIILFVGVFAFWLGLKFAFQTEFPLLAVASGSMEPVLYRGDLIVVQGGLNFTELNAAPKDAQPPGEIIVYYDPRYGKDLYHLIVHRAVEKYQLENGTWYFYTKGDASWGSSYDPWSPIRQDFIVGKVIWKAPWIGHIPLFMHENPALATLIIVSLFIVLIIMDFVFPQKEDKKPKGQKEKAVK